MMRDFNARSRDAYNKKADGYDTSREGIYTAGFKKMLLSVMELRDNDCVLDVACGNGSLLAAMSKRKQIKGFGIDISEQMIKNAVHNNLSMEFHVAGCEKIPFENCSMDIITVCAAYHHFPDVGAFAGEAARVLKPGGSLYIAEIYLPSVLRIIVNPFVPLSQEGDVRFYSPGTIIRTFVNKGFEHIKTAKEGHIQIVQMKRL